jgi:hypothetical protein
VVNDACAKPCLRLASQVRLELASMEGASEYGAAERRSECQQGSTLARHGATVLLIALIACGGCCAGVARCPVGAPKRSLPCCTACHVVVPVMRASLAHKTLVCQCSQPVPAQCTSYRRGFDPCGRVCSRYTIAVVFTL